MDLSKARLPALVVGLCALGGSEHLTPQAMGQERANPPAAVKPLEEAPARTKKETKPTSEVSEQPNVPTNKTTPRAPEGEQKPLAPKMHKQPAVANKAAGNPPSAAQQGVEESSANLLWRAAQISVVCASLLGLPFLWLTWRKRADEAFDRRRINDEIRNGRLESDIRMNVHRFEVDESGHVKMEILNTGRISVKALFSDQTVYADVLGKAASLCDASQPFPLFNIDAALDDLRAKNYAVLKRTALPTGKLMSYNLRVRLRDLMSAEYNPERRTLDTEKRFEKRRIFGILVRERSPVASTLVLCVLPETWLRCFGDEKWVENLRQNCDEHGQARIDQLKSAYEREKNYLDGHAKKSVFPWAKILFPVPKRKGPSTSPCKSTDQGAEGGTELEQSA